MTTTTINKTLVLSRIAKALGRAVPTSGTTVDHAEGEVRATDGDLVVVVWLRPDGSISAEASCRGIVQRAYGVQPTQHNLTHLLADLTAYPTRLDDAQELLLTQVLSTNETLRVDTDEPGTLIITSDKSGQARLHVTPRGLLHIDAIDPVSRTNPDTEYAAGLAERIRAVPALGDRMVLARAATLLAEHLRSTDPGAEPFDEEDAAHCRLTTRRMTTATGRTVSLTLIGPTKTPRIAVRVNGRTITDALGVRPLDEDLLQSVAEQVAERV